MVKAEFLIRKASGESELFDVEKFKHSLHRAGADNSAVELIASEIVSSLYEGITTRRIYAKAFKLLRKHNRVNALLYKLKQSLFELGKTGYPFEQFIGEVFKSIGYEVEVGKIIDGACISHEMDVIATNVSQQILVECKYAVDQGKRVSIQVPLYVRSRVDDIIKKRVQMKQFEKFHFFAAVACNTRFSSDSIEYSKCNDIMLLGWDYPEGKALKDIMEQHKVFPITVLEKLTKYQKSLLLEKKIVTCKQLLSNMEVLSIFNITVRKKAEIKRELDLFFNSQKV